MLRWGFPSYFLLKQLKKKGLARDIGVSNWSIPFLEKLLKNATIVPAVNQVMEKTPLFGSMPTDYIPP
jgi:diketogulonate reductase-like aldo/keto reductase